MSNLSHFATIANLGTHAALERLADVYREAQQDHEQLVPYTTLFLKSGLSMRGQVLALSDDISSRSVLYLIHDPNQPEPMDLTYVLMEDVAAVTIHGAMAMVEHLTDGKIVKPLGPPPSVGELSRNLKLAIDDINSRTEGAMAAEIVGLPANPSPDLVHAVNLTIKDLYAILKKLASEELGRQHLRERGFRFSIGTAEEARIQFDEAQCQITVGVDGRGVQRLSRESIRGNIEEFL